MGQAPAGGRPWVRRPISGSLTAWMPYDGGSNRQWLRDTLGRRIRPEWDYDARHWTIKNRGHLRLLVDSLVARFGEVDVHAEFSGAEQCDIRCVRAKRDDCVCSCLGVNHRGAAYWKHWRLVGDTTLVAAGSPTWRHWIAHR